VGRCFLLEDIDRHAGLILVDEAFDDDNGDFFDDDDKDDDDSDGDAVLEDTGKEASFSAMEAAKKDFLCVRSLPPASDDDND